MHSSEHSHAARWERPTIIYDVTLPVLALSIHGDADSLMDYRKGFRSAADDV